MKNQHGLPLRGENFSNPYIQINSTPIWDPQQTPLQKKTEKKIQFESTKGTSSNLEGWREPNLGWWIANVLFINWEHWFYQPFEFMMLIQFEWIRMNLSIIWRLWLNFTGSDYQYPSSGPWKVTVQQWVTEKCSHWTWYISKKTTWKWVVLLLLCNILSTTHGKPEILTGNSSHHYTPKNPPFDPFNRVCYI